MAHSAEWVFHHDLETKQHENMRRLTDKAEIEIQIQARTPSSFCSECKRGRGLEKSLMPNDDGKGSTSAEMETMQHPI